MTDPRPRDARARDQWQRDLGRARLAPELDRLALVLALLARADGTRAVASNTWLADRLGVSVSTIQRRLHDLADAGWIALTQRGGRSGDGRARANTYALTLPSTGHTTADPDPLRARNQGGTGAGRADLNRSEQQSQQVTGDASTGHGPAWRDHPPRTDTPSEEPTTGPAVRLAALQQILDDHDADDLDASDVWQQMLERGIRHPDLWAASRADHGPHANERGRGELRGFLNALGDPEPVTVRVAHPTRAQDRRPRSAAG